MNYEELWGEVKGSIPDLSSFLAKRFIQRAWRAIRDTRTWSFLQAEGLIYVPASISTGTIQVTKNLKTFQADATAIAALNNLANPVID